MSEIFLSNLLLFFWSTTYLPKARFTDDVTFTFGTLEIDVVNGQYPTI